jgi:hypothetical protein
MTRVLFPEPLFLLISCKRMDTRLFNHRGLAALGLFVFWTLFPAPGARGQDAAAAPAKPSSSGTGGDRSLAAADEVLEQVSALTHLSLHAPLKKSLRSREEIRAYVLKRMKEDKSAEERYASQRAAIAFGLVPKDFPMEAFLVELLTEQIAGLYDPEGHEFYIADWIPLDDQRMVMAHELTHALEDQHFQIEKWLKAAQPNDDAELAREAVLEGTATAAMIDYLLQGTGRSLRELPDLDPELLIGELGDTPTLKKAPPFIKDMLIFPYFSGMRFSKAFLERSGWAGLAGVFERPPVSTQQILHPELYLEGRKPAVIDLPVNAKLLRGDWKQLLENTLGEFGWKEVLQPSLGKERAATLAKEWAGDHYVLLEEKKSKKLVLLYRVRWSDEQHASQFWRGYVEVLEKKYAQRAKLFRQPNFFSFDAAGEIISLRCVATDCLVVEGGSTLFFNDVCRRIGWDAAPMQPKLRARGTEKTGSAQASP